MTYEIINTKEGKKAVKPEMERPDIIASSYIWGQYESHLLTLPTIDLHESLRGLPLGPVEGVREEYQTRNGEGSKWFPTEYTVNDGVCESDRRIILVPVEQKTSINYTQTVPDSHSWTDFEMLLRWLSHYRGTQVDVDYLIVGLGNSIKNAAHPTPDSPALEQEIERLKGLVEQLYTMYNRGVMFPDKLEQHWQQFKTDNNL